MDTLKYYMEKRSRYPSADREKSSIESLRNTPDLQTVHEEEEEETFYQNGFTNSLSGNDESIQQEDERISVQNKINMDISDSDSEDNISLKSEKV